MFLKEQQLAWQFIFVNFAIRRQFLTLPIYEVAADHCQLNSCANGALYARHFMLIWFAKYERDGLAGILS
jgi:hypothetical protein